jgi:hypothetical protein
MSRLPALLSACLVMVVLPGCAASLSIGGPASPDPRCPARPVHQPERLNGPLILTAQSVPSASLVPCLRQLPAGWTFRELHAERGRTRIELDLGRTNNRAVIVTLTRRCDAGSATSIASDRPAARRYDKVDDLESGYQGKRYYLFAGGCVTYRFDVRGGAAAQAVAAISRSLSFVDRAVLRRYVHDYSGGRVELDP